MPSGRVTTFTVRRLASEAMQLAGPRADAAGWRADLVLLVGPVGAALPVTDSLGLEVAVGVDGRVAGHWPGGGVWVGTASVHHDLGACCRALDQLA